MDEKESSSVDLFGIAASIACAVHCVATSAAMALLPQYGYAVRESDLVHQLFAGFVAFFCLVSIYRGYIRHSDIRILLLFGLGLALVITATFLLPPGVDEIYETAVLCLGSLTLITAHILNIYRWARCC